MDTAPTFVALHRAAARLGLPRAWVRREAQAGRIPHVRAGRHIFLNLAAVEAALDDRARPRPARATGHDRRRARRPATAQAQAQAQEGRP